MDHEAFMRRAIALSREKMADGDGGPFAALVVKDGAVIGEGWNQVTGCSDPTAHAEIVAIRDACRALGDFSLAGAVMYATCEPCPMCLGAIYWSRLSGLYYANTTEDAARIGFDDAAIYTEIALPMAERSIGAVRLPSDEARAVFDEWDAKADKIPY